MALPVTEDGWKRQISDFIKGYLALSGATYEHLAYKMKKYGFDETKASITMKLKRGSFSAAWFFCFMAATDTKVIKMNMIENPPHGGKIPHPRRRSIIPRREYEKNDRGQDG